jgi:hypothetical protein
MEEVSSDAEPPMKGESALHSNRSSQGTQCASINHTMSTTVCHMPQN